MDDFRLKEVRRWVEKASNDLAAAEIILESRRPISDIVCFLAQQCVEKGLKAFLVYSGIHIHKTHDLVKLVKICAENDEDFFQLEDVANTLSNYAVETRYPGDLLEMTNEDATKAVEEAKRGLEFIIKKMPLFQLS